MPLSRQHARTRVRRPDDVDGLEAHELPVQRIPMCAANLRHFGSQDGSRSAHLRRDTQRKPSSNSMVSTTYPARSG